MQYGSLVFGKDNYVMVRYYKEMNEMYADYAHKNTLDILSENMSNALIVNTEDVPEDVVQIYSTITVTAISGWRETFRLVPPYEENIRRDSISVISTLGASVIGLSEGEIIKYGLPGDILALKIEKVAHDEQYFKANTPKDIFKNVLPEGYKNSIILNI